MTKKKKRKLTDKEEQFCYEFIKDFDKKNAAIRAGYSKKSAYQIGHSVYKKPEVQAFIQELRNEIIDENIASAKEVEEFLTKAMRGEIAEENVLVVGTGEGLSQPVTVSKKIPTKDQIRAAELLGKRYAMFTDKRQTDETSNIVIEIGNYDDGED